MSYGTDFLGCNGGTFSFYLVPIICLWYDCMNIILRYVCCAMSFHLEGLACLHWILSGFIHLSNSSPWLSFKASSIFDLNGNIILVYGVSPR